jgi:hypothetical protein
MPWNTQLDMDRLRELDPNGASTIQSFAYVALREMESAILDRLERLDSDTLGPVGLWHVREICRDWAALWAECHPCPDERERWREVVERYDEEGERIQAKVAARLKQMGVQ